MSRAPDRSVQRIQSIFRRGAGARAAKVRRGVATNLQAQFCGPLAYQTRRAGKSTQTSRAENLQTVSFDCAKRARKLSRTATDFSKVCWRDERNRLQPDAAALARHASGSLQSG